MERITLAAFCLSPEFEADILAKYDVKIVNKTYAPWEVAFKGTPANLFAMQVEHFGKIEELRFGGYEVENMGEVHGPEFEGQYRWVNGDDFQDVEPSYSEIDAWRAASEDADRKFS